MMLANLFFILGGSAFIGGLVLWYKITQDDLHTSDVLAGFGFIFGGGNISTRNK